MDGRAFTSRIRRTRLLPFTWITLLSSLLAAAGQTTILSVIPTNGATAVSGTAPLVFTFSTNMNTEATSVYLFAGTSVVLMSTTWSADGTRMTNTPVSPYPGNTAINWMIMGQSDAGVALGGVTTGTFTTGSSGAVSPTILTIVPPTGSSNVAPTAPVIFTFSTNMMKAASQALFYNSLGSPVAVTAAWNANGTQLTNTPNPTFGVSTYITWFVTGQDTAGHALSGTVNGAFTTGNSGNPAPTLASTSPTNNAVNVAPAAAVFFSFSVAMNTNLTAALFYEPSAASTFLPVTAAWNAERTMLMCTPSPAFPGSKVIAWTVQGQAATGETLAGTSGSFTTAASGNGAGVLPALLSRGEIVEQTDTNLFLTDGQEFQAVAGTADARAVAVASPALATNTLSSSGTIPALEYADTYAEAGAFAAHYPTGIYQLRSSTTSGVATASISLSDGLLPAAARLLNWQNPPYAILAQPVALQWTWEAGGASVSYVRVRIEQEGKVVFASPLPDAPDALNAASNNLVVPAGVFTNAGVAEVRITCYSFTGLNSNTIPGVTLRAARHRTTAIALRIVDGATPPPALRSTNLAGLAVGEPCLFILRMTNGVRPIRFALVSGALPPGMALGAEGALSGQASSAGTFDVAVQLTDLLGQRTTQSLRIVTAQLPLSATPRLENIGRSTGATMRFDLVGGGGADCLVERSTNLVSWIPHLTTNSPLNQLSLQVPTTSAASFYRARSTNGTLPRTRNPLTVVPVLNSNATASAELTWLGGTLRLTNAGGYVFTLNVPAGALRRPEVITMTEITRMDGLPLSGGLRAAVDLKPEGLVFHAPARLDITSPTALDPAATVAFGALANGSQFALRPSFVTNSTVSQFLRHFSSAGVGNGTSGDSQSQAQGHPPDDPNSAADQDAASAIQSCRVDPSCDINSEETKAKLSDIYVKLADQVILPGLKTACASASDDAVDQALFKWLDWARQITTLGLVADMDGGTAAGELANRMRRATAMATLCIVNGITRACDQCRQHDLQRMARVFRLAQMGELLGFASQSQYDECVQKCLVYKLTIEAEITATTSSGTFRTKTKIEPKLSLKNDSGEKYGEAFTGTGTWTIEELEPVESRCPTTTAPASGSGRFPTVLVDLFQERTIQVPMVGQFVVYEYDPKLWVVLGAELSGPPSENITLHCEDVPPQTIDRLFGPAFLVMHADEVGSDETGSMVFWMRNFTVGSGETLFTKDYQREQATSKGPVKETTHIELRHTPK